MPPMTELQLIEQLAAVHPKIRAVFISPDSPLICWLHITAPVPFFGTVCLGDSWQTFMTPRYLPDQD